MGDKTTRAIRRLTRKIVQGEQILNGDCASVEELRDVVKELKDGLETVENVAEQDTSPTVDQELDTISAKVTDLVVQLQKAVKDCETTLSNQQNTGSSSGSGQSSGKSNLAHFEKVKPPKFDGSIRGYVSFKRKFTRWIYQKCDDEELAMLRLVDSCIIEGSPAWHLVKNKKSVSEAFKALDARFGRKDAVRDAILCDVKNIPPVKKLKDAAGLRNLVTVVQSAKEDLVESGLPKDCLGEAALSSIMAKLPILLCRQIDLRIHKEGLDTSDALEALIEDVTQEATIHELNELRLAANQPVVSNSKVLLTDDHDADSDSEELLLASGGDGAQKGYSRKVCVLHPKLNNHNVSECREFLLRRSAAEKRDVLIMHKLCTRCFEAHNTDVCRAPYICKEKDCPCPDSHTSCLHTAFCLESCLVNSVKDLKNPPVSKEELEMYKCMLGQHTIRPSHQAYVKGREGQFFKVNVLYDSGSTLTQIRNDVVRKCGITSVNSLPSLRIRTAGNTQSSNWGEAQLFKIPIAASNSGSEPVVELKCVGVQYIGETDDKFSVQKVIPKFENLKAVDILPGPSGSIDILIGNNHPELFPVPEKTEGAIILARTPFGMIIHGSSPEFKSDSNSSVVSIAESLLVGASPAQFMVQNLPDSVEGQFGAGILGENVQTMNSCESPDLPAENLAVNAVDKFDHWTAEEDFMVCHSCDRCQSRDVNMSKEDQRRLKVYRECLSYNEEQKRFYAKMPWNSNFREIPDNKSHALKRLASLTKSMQKSEFLKEKYIEEFDKAIQEEVLVEVTPEQDLEWKSGGEKVWYVDHFAVENKTSKSTPVRVVTDPTSAYHGIVINELFEPPPNLIPPIDSLILAFRAKRVPVAMDIKRAYRSVFLEQEESHLHRLLWNGLDTESPVKIYRMVKNNWGLRPAGALCSLAMQLIAEKFRTQYPHVYQFVIHQIYVDDGVFSVDSVEEALALARDTFYVMRQASFEIKYFLIGTQCVDITEDQKMTFDVPENVSCAKEMERVLGITWFPLDDEIALNCSINFSKRRRGARLSPDVDLVNYDDNFPAIITLRLYLQVIASLYDVCGLATPASIMLKHELGRIFGLGVSWDQALPEGKPGESTPSRSRCKDLIKIMFRIRDIRFPRCLQPLHGEYGPNPSLVIFGDASQVVYGCVAYVVWNLREGENVSRLVAAKAKPYPKKPPLMSIARGELMACVFAVRMRVKLLKFLPYQFEKIVLITDSTIALSWLGQDPYRFKTWVSGRVEEIQRDSEHEEWFHVESKLNMADHCSRGLCVDDMLKCSEWQTGPQFLARPVGEWPLRPGTDFISGCEMSSKEFRINDPRMKMVSGMKPCDAPDFWPEEAKVLNLDTSVEFPERDGAVLDFLMASGFRYSANMQWYKLLRIVARTIRFAETIGSKYKVLKVFTKRNTRSSAKEPRKTVIGLKNMTSVELSNFIVDNDKFCPSKRELNLAKAFLVMQAQSEIQEEFLRSNRHRKMNPSKCHDGLWRAVGRTQNMNHTPLIIPAGHSLGVVLLRHFHVPGHHGADTTLAKASQEYWIVRGHQSANKLVSNCVLCRKLRKRVPDVSMAPLRIERLTRADPFQVVTIDLAGPYMVVRSRNPNTRQNPSLEAKVWMLVVVCVATGAAHLELVESYSTAHLLASLDNFMHLRGKPTKIIADLGSQIVGASGALHSVWSGIDQSKLMNLDPVTVQWEFIPSGAHYYVGLAERMVKAVKDSMEAVTGSRKPRLDKLQFSRLLYSIADLVNDRPLAVGRTTIAKLDEDRLIRPNDLLLGRATSDVSTLVPSTEQFGIQGKSKYLDIIRRNEAFLNCFWTKWRNYVFQILRSGNKWLSNKDNPAVRIGDVVLIKDTNAVRNLWSLGEVYDVHRSSDGIIRKATVRYKELAAKHDRKNWKVYVPSKSKFVLKSVRELVVLLKVDDK